MKAKVFHVITHLELGGAQKITLMTLERLPRERYELGLVSGPQGLLIDWANRIPAVTRIWVPSLVREVRPFKDIVALFKMWTLFRRERPMLVHTHCPKAGILGRWAARLAGVPFIFHTAHGFGFNDFQRPLIRNFYVWIERLTSKITTEHVFVSYENAAKAEKLGLTRRGEWILSRSGIDIDEYMQPGPRHTKLQEWGIGKEKVIVGMVACFKPEKSPADFVEIAARVLKQTDRVHFVMIGDGELRHEVEARIRQHGLEQRITLLGWQNIEVMPEIYRNLDVVVLTSLWEGLPRVFAEAMATGLPIVATSVGGAREAVIDGETGFLFQPHDVEGMANAVLNLVVDPDLRKRMGTSGKERVVEFDVRTAISGLESEYRKCLESRQ
jgi:glycosyltransferase involved in cell wall biosynthesis